MQFKLKYTAINSSGKKWWLLVFGAGQIQQSLHQIHQKQQQNKELESQQQDLQGQQRIRGYQRINQERNLAQKQSHEYVGLLQDNFITQWRQRKLIRALSIIQREGHTGELDKTRLINKNLIKNQQKSVFIRIYQTKLINFHLKILIIYLAKRHILDSNKADPPSILNSIF
ncbi:hypothetical protein ABPG72_022660 [Tetrahymena utriculariae]